MYDNKILYGLERVENRGRSPKHAVAVGGGRITTVVYERSVSVVLQVV